MTVCNIGYYPSLFPALGCTVNMQCVNYHLGRNPYLGVGCTCELCKCVSFADIAARVLGCTSPTAGACISFACLAGKRSWNYKICGYPYEYVSSTCCNRSYNLVSVFVKDNNPGIVYNVSPAGYCCGDVINVCIGSMVNYCADVKLTLCCYQNAVISINCNTAGLFCTNPWDTTARVNLYNGGRLASYGQSSFGANICNLIENWDGICFTVYNYGLMATGGGGGGSVRVCWYSACHGMCLVGYGGAGSIGGYGGFTCNCSRSNSTNPWPTQRPWGVSGCPGCTRICDCRFAYAGPTCTCVVYILGGGGEGGGNIDCVGTASSLALGTNGPYLTNGAGGCVNCVVSGCGGVGLDSGAGGAALMSRGVPAGCQCIIAGSAFGFGNSCHQNLGIACSFGAGGYTGSCPWAQVAGGGGGKPGKPATWGGFFAYDWGGVYYGATACLRTFCAGYQGRFASGCYTYAPQSTGCAIGRI